MKAAYSKNLSVALQEVCEGNVETLAFGGQGIVRLDNFVVFVPYTVPGDRIRFRVTELKKSFARGRVEEVLCASKFRVKPPCAIYSVCGGCQHQEFDYKESVNEKSRVLERLLQHALGMEKIPMEKPLASPLPYSYRRKMQVAVGQSTDGKKYIGLYQPFSHRIVDMETCPIQHEVNNQMLSVFRNTMTQLKWPVYDELSNTGLIRHFVGRVNQRGEALAGVITTRPELPEWEKLRDSLLDAVPRLEGLALNVNPERTNVVVGRKTYVLWGKDHLEETIGPWRYHYGPTTFFQVNTAILKPLIEIILEWSRPKNHESVLDLYCGVGTFSIPLAEKVKNVIGIEENAEAVHWARVNQELNGIKNALFLTGKSEEHLTALPQGEFALTFLDPPRKGVEEKALKEIVRISPLRIVYLSCNPATLARDLKFLLQHGWRLAKVMAADFFPQTAHIEALALLEKL